MSDAVLLALIGAISLIVTTGITGFVTIRSIKRDVKVVSEKVEEVHKATNGLTEKLKDAALAAGRAEGHAAGMQDQKTNAAVRENGRAEGVRDEKLRQAEKKEKPKP